LKGTLRKARQALTAAKLVCIILTKLDIYKMPVFLYDRFSKNKR